LRSAVVVAEVTVSMALLVTTGLVGRSVGKLLTLHPGFDKDRVLALSTALPPGRYDTGEARQAFLREVMTRIDALAGVDAVGLVNALPFSTSNETAPFRYDEVVADPDRPTTADYRIVDGEYFAAMGIPVLEGRALDARDDRAGQPVAVVNRAFLARYGGDGDVVGRRLVIGDERSRAAAVTIVGIVGDVRHWALADAPAPEIYVPYGLDPRATVSFAVRAAGDPTALASAVRTAVAAADPDQAVYDVAPMTVMVSNSLVAQSLASSVMRVFGFVALVLSSLGLYGVLAYLIGQRTQEIGVRVALGATQHDVLRLILRQGATYSATGIAIGTLGAVAFVRVLSTLAPEVIGADPWTFVAVICLLLSVALVASYMPARRGANVDPISALRAD
jgi:predicted permease